MQQFGEGKSGSTGAVDDNLGRLHILADEPQYVDDASDHIAFGRVIISGQWGFEHFAAGGCHARRVGKRQVIWGIDWHFAVHGNLALIFFMQFQCFLTSLVHSYYSFAN